MGTLEQKVICQDCYERLGEEEDTDGLELRHEASFWVEMEFMTKQELLQHIKSTECPECNSDNWRLTDESRNR